jgi:hypothetical protein
MNPVWHRTVRWRVAALVITLLAAIGLVTVRTMAPAAAATPVSTNVQFFYYPWYGNPSVFGSYRHWPQAGVVPPDSISSNFYPVAGAYDSADPATVAQQMRWIAQAGVGTIVYSWWGQGSYEDSIVPIVMNQAAIYGIKVDWHIEPYTGRTAASVVSDINYINAHYGSSPAFYRDAAHGNKPAFYIFQSLFITDWTALDAVTGANIVLAQTTDTSKVAHFNGMYTYDGIAGLTETGWAGVGAYCAAHGMVWSPSVAPGYLDDRAVPGNTTPTVDRNNGATYDQEWTNAITPSLGGNPNWVSITSFNEWHEGSQVEPATSTPPAGYGYLTYNGAYGQTGTAAQTAYLDRTRYWVSQFTNGVVSPTPSPTPSVSPTASPTGSPTQPPAGTNLALHKAVSGSQTQTYAPGNTVDGNATTYWESADNAFPQTITVDLGSIYTVNKVVMKLPPSWGARTQTASISGSSNNSTYTAMVGSTGYAFNPTSADTVAATFGNTTTRYVRVTFTANSGWPAGQLSEFEVYGPGTVPSSPPPSSSPPASPALSLSPASLSFGNQVLGSTSVAQTITVHNTGTGAAAISATGVTGDFARTTTCGSTLAAGASCALSVTFRPTVVGVRPGAVSVTSNASGSPQSAALSGTGVTAGNPNLAAGRPVTDTGHADVYVSSNVVDADSSTYWESANNAFPQWITIDLGSVMTVSRIVLKLPPQSSWATRSETIAVSGGTNGTVFTTIVGPTAYTFNPATGNTVTISFAPTQVRYLRLTFTANTGWPAAQLSSFEVYAS